MKQKPKMNSWVWRTVYTKSNTVLIIYQIVCASFCPNIWEQISMFVYTEHIQLHPSEFWGRLSYSYTFSWLFSLDKAITLLASLTSASSLPNPLVWRPNSLVYCAKYMQDIQIVVTHPVTTYPAPRSCSYPVNRISLCLTQTDSDFQTEFHMSAVV